MGQPCGFQVSGRAESGERCRCLLRSRPCLARPDGRGARRDAGEGARAAVGDAGVARRRGRRRHSRPAPAPSRDRDGGRQPNDQRSSAAPARIPLAGTSTSGARGRTRPGCRCLPSAENLAFSYRAEGCMETRMRDAGPRYFPPRAADRDAGAPRYHCNPHLSLREPYYGRYGL
jgi:hypothetical protein